MPGKRPPLVISMGDPAGVGPEIILKLFKRWVPRTRGGAAVVRHAAVLAQASRIRGLRVPLAVITDPSEASAVPPGTVPVLEPAGLRAGDVVPGETNAACGRLSFRYVTDAIDLARQKRAAAVVTAPISKDALHRAGIRYDGHTEILAERCGVKHFAMMMAGRRVRVIMVTTHCALGRVPRLVTARRVGEVLGLAARALRELGIRKGRMAVLALNPHAGENGLFGNEEKRSIIPAIVAARKKGMIIDGPLPPDTAFIKRNIGRYDMFVCMYHDQALIPFKHLEFDTGVNVTVGLPIIRTSVDHGTAFDIAGTGKADETSLYHACRLAEQLYRNRTDL